MSSFSKHTLYCILILLFLNRIEAEPIFFKQSSTNDRFKEITKVDITLYKDIMSTDISVFGLYLSMKPEEIVRVINQFDFLYVEKDVFNENRLYLYDDKGNDSDNTLAYLILDENTLDLKEIILYPNMIKYIIGNSKKLLTFEMTNLNSDIVRYFTGPPDQRKKILDIPSLHMESYSYFYKKRNFILTKHKKGQKTNLSLSFVSNSTF